MRVRDIFLESGEVLAEAARTLPEPLERAADLCVDCLRSGGTVLTCGNGGSAADAQHLAAELVCRFRRDRGALAAVALSVDTSALTAIANDYGFERVFSRQVEALGKTGDVLVAISTSGTSANVVEAAREARERGIRVVALTGENGRELARHADILLAAPSAVVARIQEVHGLAVHVLAELVEEAFSA